MKLKKICTSVDAYGTQVSLNFRGSNKFKSFSGGLLTLILSGIALCFILVSLVDLITYQKPTI